MSEHLEQTLLDRHLRAEEKWTTFSYASPDGVGKGKGMVQLGRGDCVRDVVQVG